jgi:hypothetical protein
MSEQPRYVKLPNGSYLEWPQNVPADEFKAKALKVMGGQPKPETAVDKMFPHGGEMSIGAVHDKPGLAGIESSLNDLRTRLSMSAQKGVGQGTGDFMASLPLGLLRLLKGGTEVPQGKIWQGTKDIAGGAGEAATITGMVLGPELGEIPSGAERAGKLFQEVEKIAGHSPINVNPPGLVAMKIQELAQSGGSMPKVVRDFLNRVTKPGGAPLTYSEARQFYSNASRLSADEMNRLTPVMKRQVGQFTQALGDSLWETAQSVGKGKTYNAAMKGYRRASQVNRAKDTILPWAAKGAAGAAGAGAIYKLMEMMK